MRTFVTGVVPNIKNYSRCKRRLFCSVRTFKIFEKNHRRSRLKNVRLQKWREKAYWNRYTYICGGCVCHLNNACDSLRGLSIIYKIKNKVHNSVRRKICTRYSCIQFLPFRSKRRNLLQKKLTTTYCVLLYIMCTTTRFRVGWLARAFRSRFDGEI